MTAVWVIIAIIVAVIILILVPVLVVPFHVLAAGGFRRVWHGSVFVTWLWRFIKVRYLFREQLLVFYLAGLKILAVHPRRKEKKQKKTKPEAKKKRTFPFTAGAVISMMRKTWRFLAPRGRVSGAFGTGDPADTGIIYGILMSVMAPLPVPVRVTPDFWQSVLILEGSLSLRVHVGRLAVIFLGR